MKHRNIMAVLFFSIITLGIYDLFWLASTKKVLNEKTKVHTPTLWLLFAPILLLIVAIGVVIVTGAMSEGSQSGSASVGMNIGVVLVYVVAFLAIIPITFYWFFRFSKAVNEYTNGEMNTAVTFLLLWILRFIGLAVIQDKFNEMNEGDNSANPIATNDPVVSQNTAVPSTSVPTPAEPTVATPMPTESPEPSVSTEPPTTSTVG